MSAKQYGPICLWPTLQIVSKDVTHQLYMYMYRRRLSLAVTGVVVTGVVVAVPSVAVTGGSAQLAARTVTVVLPKVCQFDFLLFLNIVVYIIFRSQKVT